MKTRDRYKQIAYAPFTAAEILLGKYEFKTDLVPCETESMSWKKKLNLAAISTNLICQSDRPLNMPIHMQIELTNYCNLECPICPTGAGLLERKPSNMSLDLLERLVQEVGPYLLTIRLWGWGESLLHPQLAQALNIISKYPVINILSTNGQNLNTQKVQDALLLHQPKYLIVAMDGLTNETNSVFRKKARIEPILEGVKELRYQREIRHLKYPRIHLRFIAMKHNEHEASWIAHFGRTHGFDAVQLRTLSIIDKQDEIRHRDMIPEKPSLRAYKYRGPHRQALHNYICDHVFAFPTVLSDGTVLACEQDYNAQLPYGLMQDGSTFKSIWQSERAMQVRKQIRDACRGSRYVSFCANCPFRDRAGSTCNIAYWEV